MKKRNPIFVFLVGFITIFIYSWYWLVKTKGEMNKMGQKIPTAFIWLIPIVGTVWWMWKYSEGVENVTGKELNKVLAFVVLYLLGPIGHAIVQDYFNKAEPAGATTSILNPNSQQFGPSPISPPQAPSTATPTPVTTPVAQPTVPTPLNTNSQQFGPSPISPPQAPSTVTPTPVTTPVAQPTVPTPSDQQPPNTVIVG